MFEDGFDDSLLDIPEYVKEEAKEYQEKYTEGGALIGLVTQYIETKFPLNWETLSRLDRRQWIKGEFNSSKYSPKLEKRNVISSHEIAFEMLGIDDPGNLTLLFAKLLKF